MSIDQFTADANILELQARQSGQVRVRFGIQAGTEKIDDFNLAPFTGTCLEQFFFTGFYRSGF